MDTKVRLLCIALVAAILFSLSACSSETERPPIIDAEVKLQETDELVIYIPQTKWDNIAKYLTGEFKEFYSDVEVTVKSIPEESYGSVVATEIMAGSGPDVIFPTYMKDSDLYKMMDSGALLNLDGVIEQDERFHPEDYVDGVLEGAHYRGGLYAMPLSYQTPYLISDEESVAASGFSQEAATDGASFLSEVVRVTEAYRTAGHPNYEHYLGGTIVKGYPQTYLRAMLPTDLQLVDYETGATLPDEETLRAQLEALKKYYDMSIEVSGDVDDPSNWYYGGIIKGLYSCCKMTDGFYSGNLVLAGAKGSKQTPYFNYQPGKNGGKYSVISDMLAINAGSKNQQNAWNYVKLGLSFAAQATVIGDGYLYGYPVLKQAYTDEIGYLQTDVRQDWTWLQEAAYLQQFGLQDSEPLTDEEWESYVTETMTPGTVVLPLSGPVQTMLEEAALPYLEGEISLDECIGKLKDKLQIYASE